MSGAAETRAQEIQDVSGDLERVGGQIARTATGAEQSMAITESLSARVQELVAVVSSFKLVPR